MVVHSVLSGVVAGYGYEDGTLRIVFKSGKAYDYFGVTKEDVGVFTQEFGKAIRYIEGKYGKGKPAGNYDIN